MLIFATKIHARAVMEFRTKVKLPEKECRIFHDGGLMLWGSCFAENIGRYLCEGKFLCDVNPFGVLYNPLSILKAMRLLLQGKTYAESDLRFGNGQWYSLMHHSSFSSSDPAECLSLINGRMGRGSANLKNARWLIFTWGSAWVYEWKETGEVVGNCHKLPDKYFHRRLLEVDEITENYRNLFAELHRVNPDVQLLFTVSPVRHAKDGFHGNQVSKATLLLAIDKLCAEFPFCHYFPSYELMMDELRDYRFYADDMLHPSPLAVEYIWKCFCRCYFDEGTMHFLKEWNAIRKGLEHRPFDADGEAYQCFIGQILLKIESLKEKFPYLELQNEISLCRIRLKK